MAIPAIIFGVTLIGVGLVGFFGAAVFAPTALIPAGIGLVMIALGVVALNEARRKHAMHAAAALGLLTCIATGVMGARGAIAAWRVGVEIPRAPVIQLVTCGLGFVFTAMCVKSFIDARAARKRLAAASPEVATPSAQ